GSFFLIGEKLNLNPKHLLISNGVLFSISHLPGLWYLESAFHGFIYFQLLYTFGLGWMCAKARLESRGLLEPILLHFLFNSVFYLAVTNNGL
ncbi:MAG: CPBP family glutamic-type intramembrane protease, partial [Flavobacteriaceae bacterium]|nr:CPBP family glutamic-type intramembrane protease [Flavobacteriaceae bacterium]